MKNLIGDIKEFYKLRNRNTSKRTFFNSQEFTDLYNSQVNKIVDEQVDILNRLNVKRESEFVNLNKPQFKSGDTIMMNAFYVNSEHNISSDLMAFSDVNMSSKFIVKDSELKCESFASTTEYRNDIMFLLTKGKSKEQVKRNLMKTPLSIQVDKKHIRDIIYKVLNNIASSEPISHVYLNNYYHSVSIDFEKSGTTDKFGEVLFITWNDFSESSFIDINDTELVDSIEEYNVSVKEIKAQEIIKRNSLAEIENRLGNKFNNYNVK